MVLSVKYDGYPALNVMHGVKKGTEHRPKPERPRQTARLKYHARQVALCSLSR